MNKPITSPDMPAFDRTPSGEHHASEEATMINDKTTLDIKLILTLAVLLVAGVVAWTTTKIAVEANSVKADKLEEKVESLQVEQHGFDIDYAIKSMEVEQVKEDVKDIKMEQKAQGLQIQEIHDKIMSLE